MVAGAAMSPDEYLGEPRLIDFTFADGTVGKRLMRPILSRTSTGWRGWVPA